MTRDEMIALADQMAKSGDYQPPLPLTEAEKREKGAAWRVDFEFWKLCRRKRSLAKYLLAFAENARSEQARERDTLEAHKLFLEYGHPEGDWQREVSELALSLRQAREDQKRFEKPDDIHEPSEMFSPASQRYMCYLSILGDPRCGATEQEVYAEVMERNMTIPTHWNELAPRVSLGFRWIRTTDHVELPE